ncbi:unnamed protein product [Adineta steineri]|uniref:SHSP domain-containing protein n=1 Tax=Adineta steineri TaxID=433720 RepID=A0A813UEB9_9BILA|nr:unnamed protein product [Adineta steineri]
MSSQRYSESRSYQEESRNSGGINTNTHGSPYDQRVTVPIQHAVNGIGNNTSEQRVQERIRHNDTTVQWVNDPVTGKEKFRVNINIEGFSQNEVNIRVDGKKLLVYGEHIENHNDSTRKKIIEKSFELPSDIDTYTPQTTFPTPIKMQVDFPSRHSNVIIDDGRASSKHISDYDISHRSAPGFTQQKSSTEFTSTRKIGGGGSTGSTGFSISGNTGAGVTGSIGRSNTSYQRSSSKIIFFNYIIVDRIIVSGPPSHSPYQSFGGNSMSRDIRDIRDVSDTRDSADYSTNTCFSREPVRMPSPPSRTFGSSTSDFSTTNACHIREPVRMPSPPNRTFGSSISDAFNTTSNSTHTHRIPGIDTLPRTTFPASSRGEFGHVEEKTFSETHHETRHRRSSPTSGVQSSHEVEHHRSGSPSIVKDIDTERFRSGLNLGNRSRTPPSSSRNLEVREFSRRVGGGTNDRATDNDRFTSSNEPSIFAHDFNSDAFYRSAFQPQISTDDRGQKRVDMKLDVNNYQPNEIKVSVNGNDLIVQAEHSVERPPTSSSRAYFYKQLTLPPNTDLKSLASQYNPDGKLHITAKLSQEQSSIRYN